MPSVHRSDSTASPSGRALRRRRTLGLGFAAVFLSLLVLLILQYSWLGDLEHASTLARQANLENYLRSVDNDIEWFYTHTAERALNLPAEIFKPEYFFHKVGKHFAHKKVEGARRLFAVSYLLPDPEQAGWVFTYNPETRLLEEPEHDAELGAIYMAVTPWRIVYKQRAKVDVASLHVEERDARYRVILNPITDDSSRLVGLTGMVVDPDHFRDHVLPKALDHSLPPDTLGCELALTIRDGGGEPVRPAGMKWAERPREQGEVANEAERRLSFLFRDWTVGLSSLGSTPAQWARANFLFNMTLSLCLAVVLLGGLMLALRTVARDMKLSEMKSDFVSNVSHELRTPLASIRVFGELLRLGKVAEPERVREYGEYIETESRRLTQLINNILNFSRIESGRRLYRFEEADVGEVVEAALKTFEVRLRHSGFGIEYAGPAVPPPRLTLDPDALTQAVCNLLDNAVKYSNGGRRIAVRLGRAKGEAGDEVTLAVEDEGIGISREEQKKIFERFHRVSTGLVHDVKGSGLGLAIVRHIVEAHGGRVTVESEPGRGSTFTLHLPARPARRAATAAPREAPAPGEPGLEPQRS